MIAFILGTRPEIIKSAPVIHEARRRGLPFAIVHTGQHYTPELDDVFFRELDLPQPAYNLNVGSQPAAKQLAAMLSGLHDALTALSPRVVLVQGDTNSVLAGALTAHKMGIKVAHLEAGLRSDDWDMPEEANRVLAGIMADVHFCPTDVQRERLVRETIVDGVYVVGNTIVDAARHYSSVASEKSDVMQRLGLIGTHFAVLTMHRPSNVDDPARLVALMEMLESTAQELELKIVFPMHPRTEAALTRAGVLERFSQSPSFVTSKPLGYLDLLALQANAQLLLTDSGGIQEEANILRVPCITLRANTERPETVDAGGNVLFDGTDASRLIKLAREMMSRPRDWNCPFGDGTTSVRVIDILSTL